MPGLDRKCEGVGMREQQSLDHLYEFLTILFCIGISSAYKAILRVSLLLRSLE